MEFEDAINKQTSVLAVNFCLEEKINNLDQSIDEYGDGGHPLRLGKFPTRSLVVCCYSHSDRAMTEKDSDFSYGGTG